MPTRIPAGVGYHPFFFTFYMIPIDFKITIFFLYLFNFFFITTTTVKEYTLV